MATSKLRWGNYAELRPEQLAAIRKQTPVLYLPCGSIAWHGAHLPLGTDTLTVEAIGEQVVRRTGGVILPTFWLATSQTPRNDLLAVQQATGVLMWNDLFDSIALAGWQVVVVLNGLTTTDQEQTLMQAAERAMREHKLLVLAVPPLVLVDTTLMDQAALWESSLLLSVRPSLVHLYALGDDEHALERNTVRGRDPRGAASPSLGDTVMRMVVERLSTAVLDLLKNNDPAPLFALYQQRREFLAVTTAAEQQPQGLRQAPRTSRLS